LRLAAGAPVERAAVVVAILQQLAQRLASMDGGFDGILDEALRRSSTLGQWVRVQSGDIHREGLAESLDRDGRLLLREAGGALVPLSAGEVTLRA
jgi:BirA family biotin operon repressor/biotin-[acetyl-CoA-carboxylase] ligase